MKRQDFLAYIESYNSGTLDELFSHYDPALVFQSFGQPPMRGSAAFDFLRQIRGDFADRIVPINTLVDGNLVALEAILEMEAKRDLPEYFGGAKKKGDKSRLHMFAFYETEGEIIRSVRISGWPEKDETRPAPSDRGPGVQQN